jgi:hypothetical protein
MRPKTQPAFLRHSLFDAQLDDRPQQPDLSPEIPQVIGKNRIVRKGRKERKGKRSQQNIIGFFGSLCVLCVLCGQKALRMITASLTRD